MHDAAPTPPHVIVSGLGRVGTRVVALLHRLGVRVSVVTSAARDDRLAAVRRAGIEVLLGDACDEQHLVALGVAQATALVATTDHDLTNLETVLDARRYAPTLRVVLRAYNTDLGRSLETTLGRAKAIASSALAAPVLALAALGVRLLASADWRGRDYLVGELPVVPGSLLLGRTAAELRAQGAVLLADPGRALVAGDKALLFARRADFLHLAGLGVPAPPRRTRRVLGGLGALWSNAPRALRSTFLALLVLIGVSVVSFQVMLELSVVEAFYYVVTTVTTVGYGDITARPGGPVAELFAAALMLTGSVTMAILFSFATSYAVSEQLRAELGRPRAPGGGHVIVVGLGNVGLRIADELRGAGVEIVAIESSADVPAPAPDVLVVRGDARRPETLAAAAIDGARAIVAASGDGATNLAVALTARRLSPGLSTVVRMFDADLAQKVEQGGLVDAALSSARSAAPTFAAAALDDGVVAAFERDGELVVLAEVTPAAAWLGRRPSELEGGTACLATALGDTSDEAIAAGPVLRASRRPLRPEGDP